MENFNERYQWIGAVPDSWGIVRLKNIVASEPNAMVDGPFGSDLKNEEYVSDGVPIIQLNNIGIGYHNVENLKFITENKAVQLSRHKIWPGDIVMAKMADPVARGTIVSDAYPYFVISADCVRIKLSESCLPQFLVYALNSFIKHEAELLATGTTRTRINLSIAKNLHTVLPPLETQCAIVRHLDQRTAKIDALLADLQQQAAMLETYKRELIANAVTHGLDKAAPTKDSGTEWIGSIPVDWFVVPLRAVAKVNTVKNVGIRCENLLSLSYGKIIPKDIDTNFGLLPENFEGYQIVQPGYTVLRLTDLQNDKRSLRTGYVTETGIITAAYTGLIPSEDVESKYFAYLLHAYDLKKIFYGLGGGVRQSLKYSDLKTLPILIPPMPMQKAIVSYIDEKTAQVDGLITDINAQIEKLKQYRQIVIHDAVTGKIKVPEVYNNGN